MSDKLTLGSLFDGSGGFPLGAILTGAHPLWASEIEPFPIRVTTKRMPQIQHYGDVSKINGAEVPPVDIITFGSPCQDMSIAGRREGLDGSRSGLFYQAIRIVKEMRCKTNGKYPRFIIWENVPGAFPSNKGEDFRAVLEAVCQVKAETVFIPRPDDKWKDAGSIVGDGFSVAWRVLDAQYFSVPQRRKRIYLVADFAGERAGEILLECESLPGDSAASGSQGEETAGSTKDGFGETSTICLNDQGGERMDVTYDKTTTLRAESHHPPLVFNNHGQDTRFNGPISVSQTVCRQFGAGGNNQPFVVEIPQAFGICSKESNSMNSANPESGIYAADTARTLDGNGGNPACNQGGIAIVDKPVYAATQGCYMQCNKEKAATLAARDYKSAQIVSVQGSLIGRKTANGPQGDGVNADVCFTLNTVDKHAVAYDSKSYSEWHRSRQGAALKASGGSMGGGSENLAVNDEYIVRRLTPKECARLQGFPVWWCSELSEENPAEEEVDFWEKVFREHKEALGKTTKPKSRRQIKKWLSNPYSDSAEYKMWGNGVALPCVVFVMKAIAKMAEDQRGPIL